MRKVFSSLLIFVLFFFVVSTTSVSAKIMTSEKGSVTVTKTEVVNDDLFIGAQVAEIDGTVNGDVFIGAQMVKVSGTVNGNLHVGANIFELTGIIKGNVYTGAQSVMVSGGKIGGSLLAGAANVNVDKNSQVGRSVIAGAGMVSINSQVKRSVYAGAGILTVGDTARIGKDLYYAAGDGKSGTNISSRAKITGNIYKSEANTSQAKTDFKTMEKITPVALKGFKIVSTFISLIGALIVAFLFYKFFPKTFTESANFVSESFWKSLGVGFLVSISFIPVLIVLLLTVVGIPLAGLAFLLLLVNFYLSKIVVSLPLGEWISKKINWKISTYGAAFFGLLTIYILNMLPVIGLFTWIIVFWTGLGALTLRLIYKPE